MLTLKIFLYTPFITNRTVTDTVEFFHKKGPQSSISSIMSSLTSAQPRVTPSEFAQKAAERREKASLLRDKRKNEIDENATFQPTLSNR